MNELCSGCWLIFAMILVFLFTFGWANGFQYWEFIKDRTRAFFWPPHWKKIKDKDYWGDDG